MIGRSMYIWKLKPVVNTEGGVNRLIDKTRLASLQSIWIRKYPD